MSTWEYCTVVTEWRGRTPTIVSSSEMGDALIGNFTAPITDGLKALGELGWELVAIDAADSDRKAAYVLKRLVRGSSVSPTVELVATSNGKGRWRFRVHDGLNPYAQTLSDGVGLATDSAASTSTPAPHQEERRLVTALFRDLVVLVMPCDSG